VSAPPPGGSEGVDDGPPRETFAMVPVSVLWRLDAMCVHLYGVLDEIQNRNGRPARNFQRLAEILGTQARTVETHAGHLEVLGLVKITQTGRHAAVVEVVHNPARKRWNPDAVLPPVDKRSTPPRAGSRAGQKARRRSRTGDPLSREKRAGLSREERAHEPRFSRDVDGSPSREQRARSQVSKGTSSSQQQSPHARAFSFDERERERGAEPGARAETCANCGEPADGSPNRNGTPACRQCERF